MRQMRWIVGDADELRSGDFSRGLGATTETKCSHKNWKNEKRKPFMVKRKIRISYKLEYYNNNNFML